MGEILVGVDGSPNSAAALRWAVAEAELRGHRLTALFAWGYIPPGHAGDGHTFEADYRAADADAALTAAIRAAVGAANTGTIERRVVADLPARSLLVAARAADLLVVGARGVGGFRGLLLGSVSQQCLHHTSGPLAIVRAPASSRDEADADVAEPVARGRIVVAVDGSEAARRALRWALEEARLRRASLDVVHAWQAPYIVPSPFMGVPPDPGVIEKEARSLLERIVDAEDTRRQPAPVARILVQDGAARAVLDSARGADLVVLGSRGLGGFSGLLLGSVSHHVAHHAPCPVVVVP
jgi:nucleotide-binding universal stress UspA family protein